MFPFTAAGRPSSQPAYPPQPEPLPSSASSCRQQGCPHITDEVFDAEMPAFHWRSQACYTAWLESRGGPMVASVATVPRPAERMREEPLPWLGPAVPRRPVPTYAEVVA